MNLSDDWSYPSFTATEWRCSPSLFCSLEWDHWKNQSAVTSFSCSSWICRDLPWHQKVSALPEPWLSSLPGDSPGRLCPRARGEGLLSVALNLHKADVQLIDAQILDACGWLYYTACAPWDLLIHVNWDTLWQIPLISLSSSWRLLRHTHRVATVVLGLQGH